MVTVNPPSQSVEVTDSVKFTTTVSGVGKDKFSYQWKHNGVNIKGEIKGTLTFDDVTKNHSGRYQCFVTNQFGDNDNSTGELVVTGEVFQPYSGGISGQYVMNHNSFS